MPMAASSAVIVGITDIVGFYGESVIEMQTVFAEAMGDYLQTCEQLNRSPHGVGG